MLQFILMLLGLAFNNNNNVNTIDNNSPITVLNSDVGEGIDPGDTGGNTGQKPPTP
ncbi:hypothetical protein [Chryseobacterium sp.]|uniref:hypothetical protein n=1 Tax=Chryseobacterium sp. TaxID=1871047 RepID=UPI0025C5B863|nr:hypothetical protein [Chryseobacterium sp.]